MKRVWDWKREWKRKENRNKKMAGMKREWK